MPHALASRQAFSPNWSLIKQCTSLMKPPTRSAPCSILEQEALLHLFLRFRVLKRHPMWHKAVS
jgi:hypothetical protein